MTSHPPDPMRRFVPTPHRRIFSHHRAFLSIESNDPLLLMALCASLQSPSNAELVRGIKLLKIVVDHAAAIEDGNEISILESAHIRLLLRGIATILIHDTQRRELLAFLAPSVRCRELVETLLPTAILGITNA